MSQWTEKLDIYLGRAGISKKQLAGRLGISINTVGKWWRNREPSPEYVAKIEQLLQQETPLSRALPDNNSSAAKVKKERDTSSAQQNPENSNNRANRFQEKSVVISLLRTTCPFCAEVVERYRNCPKCGQHFVWANVPLD